MPATRLTCPECHSTLRPAQPVPDGKKVKCPKCGVVFVAPGAVTDDILDVIEEEELARPKPKAKAAPAKKKAPDKGSAPKPASPSRSGGSDDDNEVGTYGVVHDEPKEDDDEKRDISYAPDMSIKDLRGPAQALVIRPSNFLILIGAVGCILNIFTIVFLAWPFMFQPFVIDHKNFLWEHYEKSGKKEDKERQKNIPEKRDALNDQEKQLVQDETDDEVLWRSLFMGGFFLLIFYDGALALGAVRMQNLESRRWGIAAGAMAIFPVAAGGFMFVGWILFGLAFSALFDDASFILMLRIGVLVILWLLAAGVGAWTLVVLNKEEVVDGFNYQPD